MTLEDLEKIVQAAIEGIQARGGAQPGDKTLIDSLIPVRDAIAAHKADGDTTAALRDATQGRRGSRRDRQELGGQARPSAVHRRPLQRHARSRHGGHRHHPQRPLHRIRRQPIVGRGLL
ncbi:MAG: DAK2 domain-containing protein [Caulobacteraceae bacterium]